MRQAGYAASEQCFLLIKYHQYTLDESSFVSIFSEI